MCLPCKTPRWVRPTLELRSQTGVEAPLSFGKLLDYRNRGEWGTSSISGSSTGICIS